ncbi:MAG: MATE family efflux transporter [Lachnospiraceae bacterium]|nr:MATE family efflux transporter [Lachnospiraceae bacterium]
MEKTQNFTEGKIFAPLIRFALPVLLALFLQTMYGAGDLLIVGQFGGERADVFVSAVSTGSQVMQTLTIVITGLAMGLTVFVGRKIGEGKRDEAGKIIGSGIWLFGVIAIALTVIMVAAAPFLAEIMHAPEEAYGETAAYITICSVGTVFIVAYNLVGSIFRGIGDSKVPLITVFIACVLNIVGDLILVALFHMGAAGAAIATVSAQAVSVLISLVIIRRRELPFTFSLKDIRARGIYISKILKLGIPIALQDLLASISFLVILAIMNGLGLVVSAGVGVAEKMCGFLMLVASAYMQSMSAFVAQNIGAGKPERARKALWCGIASSLVVGIVMCLFTFFRGDLLAGIFAKDTAIILAAAEYLKAYAIDCIFTSFLFCFIGYFNGCGRTTFVMLQGTICAFGVRMPITWLMSKQIPVSLFHIGLAIPASTIVQITLCGIYFSIMLRKERQRSRST